MCKIIYFGTVCFCFFSLGFCQKAYNSEGLVHKIDSLRTENQIDSLLYYNDFLLESTKANRRSFYYAFAILNKAEFDKKSFVEDEQIKEALFIFKDFKNYNCIVRTYKVLAKLSNTNSEIDSSIAYNDSLILFVKSKQISNIFSNEEINEILLSAYHDISGNLYFKGEYENALKNELIAKQYSDSIPTQSFPKIDIGLGMINIALGRHSRARETFKALIRKTKSKPLLKFSNMSLANSFYEQKKYDSALFYFDKSKTIAREINDSSGLASILTNIGIIQSTLDDLDSAEKNLMESLEISKSHNVGMTKLNTLTGLSGVYIKQRKNDLAIKTLYNVLETAKSNNRLPSVRDSYEMLTEAYINKNDYKQALKYNQLYNRLKDSIKSADIIKNTEELELKYETEKKENENLQLKQETAQKDLTIAKKNNYLLFGSLVFAGIIISLVFYQLRKFRKKNTALQLSIERREKLEKELEVVRDNIAKDFHDDLGNKLARITTLSDLMITTGEKRDKSSIIDALGQIKQDSDILYSGTRDFMFSLKAKSDYVEELFTYLSDFGEDYFESFKIDFIVTKTIDVNKKLPYYWNRQIIMIFKEAMTNTVKYAQANEAKLDLQFVKDKLIVKFIDDGKGFDINALKRKNGLINMQTRAKKIKGDLTINTAESGTKIEFCAQLS